MTTGVYNITERVRARIVAAIRIGFQLIAAAFAVCAAIAYTFVVVLDD
jgi:hypothetical protein